MLLDIAPSEFLVIAGAAIIFIGPKDMPRALRTAGRWFAQMRRVSNHFRAGVENMIREAELAEMEKEWRERNAAIIAEHPAAGTVPSDADVGVGALPPPVAEISPETVAPALVKGAATPRLGGLHEGAPASEPELPLSTPKQPLP